MSVGLRPEPSLDRLGMDTMRRPSRRAIGVASDVPQSEARRRQAANSLQQPSGMTSTAPFTTLMAVPSRIA